MSAASPWTCSFCSGDFSAPSEELLHVHIRLVHSHEHGFSIQCSLDGCSRSFSNFKAYQNHRRLKHSSNTVTRPTTPELGENSDGIYEGTDSPVAEALALPAPSTEDMQSFASKWILKTRETRKLTRTAMQGVIEDVGDLVTFVSKALESQTRAVLHLNGVDPDSVSGLEEVYDGAATKPFEGLQSFYQQIQYCSKHFNLIVSNIMYIRVLTNNTHAHVS